jgi:hypothetical protein
MLRGNLTTVGISPEDPEAWDFRAFMGTIRRCTGPKRNILIGDISYLY